MRRKEVSINSLWQYQVNFIKERGRDHAALDMMKRHALLFSEEEFSFLLNKGIVTKNDLELIIHGKYKKISLLKMFLAFFKGIRRIKLMLKMRKAAVMSNKIYSHYKKMPKEDNSRLYLEWLLGHMSLFEEIEQK